VTVELDERVIESSKKLRVWVHEANNALFVARGFMEEIGTVIKEEEYRSPDFDRDDLVQMFEKVSKGLMRAEEQIRNVGTFARKDIFEMADVKKPD
jgi:hypothetical protein